MCGPSFEVGIDAVTNLVLTAPRYNGIDKAVATAVLELGVSIPPGFKIVGLVRQPRDVRLHILRRHHCAGLRRVAFENHCLCGTNPWLRADLRAFRR